jgi:hypothetical protein
MAFGIGLAYAAINAVLIAFSRQSQPQPQAAPVLMAKGAAAGD